MAHAGTFYWDQDLLGINNSAGNGSTGLGGAVGGWNTTASQWWAGNGLTDQAWNNATDDTAIFWGTAGTATLATNITVGGLQFNTTGYTLTGQTITFGTSGNVELDNVAAATINSNLAGSAAIDFNGGPFQAAGTVTLGGTGTGFTGATTIENNMTVLLSGATATALSNTNALTLNGGTLNVTNTTTDTGVAKVNVAAPITANGGSITYTNTTGTVNYAMSLGALAINAGQTAVVSTNATSAGSTEKLTFAGLTQNGTGTVAFVGGGGLNTTTNQQIVTGATATPTGQIIGPWATTGTAANAQTDYAVFTAAGNITAAAIVANAETNWTNPGNAYTVSATTILTDNRNMVALKSTGAAITVTVASAANLGTTGILNAGTGILTIAATGTGVVTLPLQHRRQPLRQHGQQPGDYHQCAGE